MKKKTAKIIRELANKLPTMTVEKGKSVRARKGSTFTKAEKDAYYKAALKHNAANPVVAKPLNIDDNKWYNVGFRVNHNRRMRRAYERGGIKAIDKYLAQFNMQRVPPKTEAAHA